MTRIMSAARWNVHLTSECLKRREEEERERKKIDVVGRRCSKVFFFNL